MKIRSSRLLVVVLSLVGVVILLGGGFTAGWYVRQGQPDPFAYNPAGKTAPQFAATMDAAAGFPRVTKNVPGTSTVAKDGANLNRLILTSSDKNCTLTLGTNFAQSFTVHETQQYISQSTLYTTANGANTTLSGESTAYVKSNKDNVIFVTGSYKTQGHTVFVAARAFTKLYPNGINAGGKKLPKLYGSDPTLGVPVLNANYTCQSGNPTQAQFDQILNAISVTF